METEQQNEVVEESTNEEVQKDTTASEQAALTQTEHTQPSEQLETTPAEEKEEEKVEGEQTTQEEQLSTSTEAVSADNEKKKKKKDKKKRKRAPPVLTDEDFGPLIDFTMKEGFVYDPEKGKLDDEDIKLKRRPWVIPDVRSVLYLRRLERRHNKLVHGLASVRQLTPKQILKEEIREITKYNEEMRQAKERENIKNKIYEVVDNEIHFQPENMEELEQELLLHVDEKSFVCSERQTTPNYTTMSDEEGVRDIQEPPPGTDLHEGSYCWKCNGTGILEVKRKRVTCKVCNGSKIIKSEKRRKVFNKPGLIMPDRRWPAGWTIPGPEHAEDVSAEDLQPAKGEALCSLVGKWKIFQKQGGHRFSTDDVTTAWVACHEIEEMRSEGVVVDSHLDMGCGLGSVLMMVGWRYPELTSTGIEAQRISYGLAQRSIRFNGASERMTVYHGDLRDENVLPIPTHFPIVTGTPPYFKAGEGALSAKVDQKACLFEFRGGVEAYIEAASRYLTEKGRFVVVESALARKRIDEGCREHGMKIRKLWDFIPKTGKPALFVIAVIEKRREGDVAEEYPIEKMTIRNKEGQYTKEYHALLRDMGFPPQKEAEDYNDII